MADTIRSANENGVLTIFLCGRIDSANAPQTEDGINRICGDNPHDAIVIDAAELQYVSSAGLRIFLRLRKSGTPLKIVHASADLYDILDMTGFTGIIEVEQA